MDKVRILHALVPTNLPLDTFRPLDLSRLTLLRLDQAPHMKFAPPYQEGPCSVCGGAGIEGVLTLNCERCGVAFHDACFRERVASDYDRAWLDAPAGAPAGAVVRIFSCHGCRS